MVSSVPTVLKSLVKAERGSGIRFTPPFTHRFLHIPDCEQGRKKFE
jgi:hypothetical protein